VAAVAPEAKLESSVEASAGVAAPESAAADKTRSRASRSARTVRAGAATPEQALPGDSAAVPAIARRDARAEPLPSQPSREQVVQALTAVQPRLKECVGDKHGTAQVTVTVRAAGFVSYALVGGTFAGTPAGSCIAQIVKESQFPAFTDPFIRVTFPYQL
jgi:hypothetical protein